MQKFRAASQRYFLHATLQGKFDMAARLLKKATKSDYLEKMLSFFGIDE